jgi:hypothetical protein
MTIRGSSVLQRVGTLLEPRPRRVAWVVRRSLGFRRGAGLWKSVVVVVVVIIVGVLFM